MKKICIFLSSLLSFIFLFTFSACNFNKNKNIVPIQLISTNFTERTLIIGEEIDLSISVSPVNHTDIISIQSENPTIASVNDNKITGRSIGETNIIISTKAENRTRTIKIRVIEKVEDTVSLRMNYTDIYNTAIIFACCKYYDVNWRGQEQNVEIEYGTATIIRIAGNKTYFLTDKNLFTQGGSGQQYEKWYIMDGQGGEYNIESLDYHINARIAIGCFSSPITDKYAIATIQENIYLGDYAINPFSYGEPTRITSKNYEAFYSDTAVSVFHFTNTANTISFGDPIFNSSFELIGIIVEKTGSQITAVSGTVIQELVARYFNE